MDTKFKKYWKVGEESHLALSLTLLKNQSVKVRRNDVDSEFVSQHSLHPFW